MLLLGRGEVVLAGGCGSRFRSRLRRAKGRLRGLFYPFAWDWSGIYNGGMSEDSKPKVTGIAAVGAAFAAMMMKGGVACGHALSHSSGAVHIAEDAAKAASHVSPGALKAAEEGGMGLVEAAGEKAARRASALADSQDRIVNAGATLARGEVRRRAREEREEARKRRASAGTSTP